MSEIYRIKYSRQAADQLEEAFEYIERDSPRHARLLISRILNAIESLEILPHRFSLLRGVEGLETEVRSMPAKPYLVRYHVDDVRQLVTIMSVRHGSRRAGL